MQKNSFSVAFHDVRNSLRRYSLVAMLGWQDLRQRYRRSALGPFWLTISMGVMIGTIGVVFGQIFKAPMGEFLPFLAVGMILWTFMSTVISEGGNGFIAAEGVIKQLPIPLFVHILRLIWRNILILAHNIVIFPLVLIAVAKPLTMVALISIPGLLLLILNLTWIALVLGVLCTRYRDLPQIVTSVLQVVFYLTPIMWMPNLLPERSAQYFLNMNPVYHLMEIVRAPLVGAVPTLVNWEVSIGLAIVGWIFALFFYGRYKSRIAYWL
ncbi:ABC transporter permease [Pseudomonas sp. HMWF006]|uniref:ABC transporter permease n=1 Tax=Pseudomonas sp. HMWF006 TaxID=2056843 RepID=UPI000D4B1988|nr:ABC transporter permease [Pseudomonas sp. HMWF006]PTT05398.1 ABC transporter permease [Pseudomonas sp. HMWF006]PTT67584.1 ABC transporter permease [Pseudomonas sp. HMWF007]PTT92782.1 ABC transporter permease [Pseudomonas sp. HMWF005]